MIAAIVLVLVFGSVYSLRYHGEKSKLHRYYTSRCAPPEITPADISFRGHELNLPDQQLHVILVRRFPYYRHLPPHLQRRFLGRLKDFMRRKTFIIKDDEGFKEMPVLVSAAAIQLCFGLKEYRLPFYQYIRIYPQEYVARHDLLKILTGNVHNNVISVAWNHLLSGYAEEKDGVNVGLHEMSHALYIQKIVIEANYATQFARHYNLVLSHCKDAHRAETAMKKANLYSEYAESTPHEFWAESVELFFERPSDLKSSYPGVYEAMRLLLNQDPLQAPQPLLSTNSSFAERFRGFLIR